MFDTLEVASQSLNISEYCIKCSTIETAIVVMENIVFKRYVINFEFPNTEFTGKDLLDTAFRYDLVPVQCQIMLPTNNIVGREQMSKLLKSKNFRRMSNNYFERTKR